MPDGKDRLNHAPTRFNHVGALEERGVADHAIAQQALVTGAVFRAAIGGVVEIHFDEAGRLHRAGKLRGAAERSAVRGLDVTDGAMGYGTRSDGGGEACGKV